ncbi:MAG: ribosomal-processing cysteine protease Prp [Clostridia bacterium]|nr:ribosomal-processing cysteine protease Prp [Clostridia bacterium]
MIRIFADKIGDRCRFLATGHAMAGAEREAVCTGVSALAGALIFYALQAPDCHRVRYSMQPGEVFLSCHGLDQGFALVMNGLAAMAEQYPEDLVIERQPHP